MQEMTLSSVLCTKISNAVVTNECLIQMSDSTALVTSGLPGDKLKGGDRIIQMSMMLTILASSPSRSKFSTSSIDM